MRQERMPKKSNAVAAMPNFHFVLPEGSESLLGALSIVGGHILTLFYRDTVYCRNPQSRLYSQVKNDLPQSKVESPENIQLNNYAGHTVISQPSVFRNISALFPQTNLAVGTIKEGTPLDETVHAAGSSGAFAQEHGHIHMVMPGIIGADEFKFILKILLVAQGDHAAREAVFNSLSTQGQLWMIWFLECSNNPELIVDTNKEMISREEARAVYQRFKVFVEKNKLLIEEASNATLAAAKLDEILPKKTTMEMNNQPTLVSSVATHSVVAIKSSFQYSFIFNFLENTLKHFSSLDEEQRSYTKWMIYMYLLAACPDAATLSSALIFWMVPTALNAALSIPVDASAVVLQAGHQLYFQDDETVGMPLMQHLIVAMATVRAASMASSVATRAASVASTVTNYVVSSGVSLISNAWSYFTDKTPESKAQPPAAGIPVKLR